MFAVLMFKKWSIDLSKVRVVFLFMYLKRLNDPQKSLLYYKIVYVN